MDHDLIYAKTASGEGAMLQRTRVMQRNVRMVLILVDSQSSVADLCLKTGNPQLTENALQELEKGGFIEPRVDPDSMWVEGDKVAQEIRAAADSHRKIQIARTASRAVTEPSAGALALSAGAVSKAAAPSDLPISVSPHASLQAEPISPPVITNTGARSSAEGQQPSESAPSLVERVSAYFVKRSPNVNKAAPSFFESLRSLAPSQCWSEEATPSAERVETQVPGSVRTADEALALKPIRRRNAESIGWPAIIVLGIAGMLAVAFVTVLLFPYHNYLSELEIACSNASGRPVKVGAMQVNVYPQPTLLLADVRVGVGQDEIRIDEIRLQPAIGTLMAEKIVFREVVVSGVAFPVDRIAGLPSVFVALSNPSARFGIDHLSLEKAAISFAGLGLSGMDGEARLSADGQLQSFRLRSSDRRLNLVATPLAQGLDVVVEGYGWRPAQNSSFLFDSLNLNATFESGELLVKNMALRIFDGVVEGKGVLRADRTPSIVGELSFKRVNVSRFGGAIGVGQQFSGEIAGKMRFSAKGQSWPSIFSAIDADGDFTMHRGIVRGIDLIEAARSISRTPIQGGATQFESLSGTIRLTPTRYQFSGLVLNSGLMQSTGYLDVSSELKLSGKMELKMRGTANQTRVPISIYGALSSPLVEVGRGG